MPPVSHPFKKGLLIVLMNYNDHAPPHVHVKYQGDVRSYRIEIQTRTWMRNYSGVYEVSRVSALRSESEAAQTVPIRDFQSLKPAFLRDPLNAYLGCNLVENYRLS